MAFAHPDRAGDHELFIWCRELREHVAGEAAPPDLARELSSWFRGRFNGVVADAGHVPRALGYGKPGPSLPERAPLTPAQ